MKKIFSLNASFIVFAATVIFVFVSVSEGQQNNVTLDKDGAHFGGSNTSYVKIPSFRFSGSDQSATAITVAFWMKATEGTPVSYSVKGHTANEFVIWNKGGSGGKLGVIINGQERASGTAADLVYDDKEHHIALIWRKTTGNFKLYVDGQDKVDGQDIWYPQAVSKTEITSNSNGGLVFGQEQDSYLGGFETSQSLDGTLRDFAIWNGIMLDKDQIKQVMNSTPLAVEQEHLVGCWFWEPKLESPDINTMQEGSFHVAVNDSLAFQASPSPSNEYTWQNMRYIWTKNDLRSDAVLVDRDFTEISETREYSFNTSDRRKICFKAFLSGWKDTVNSLELSLPLSLPKEIPVRVWDPPEVLPDPPDRLIATDPGPDGAFSPEEMAGKASWLGGKFVGVVEQPIKLAADGQTQNDDPNERIARYEWDLGDQRVFEQRPMPRHFNGTVNDYAISQPFDMPAEKITVAFRMQADTSKERHGTPVSYAVVDEDGKLTDNEFTIYDYQNFVIYIKGMNTGSTGVSADDGELHHIAVTWDSSDGSVTLYKDWGSETQNSWHGNIAETQGESITSGGAMVVGQEQDALGGGFSDGQAFAGTLDYVAIWDKVLTEDEIDEVRKKSPTACPDGLVSLQGEYIEYTFDGPIGDGSITCKAVTNYGIESDERTFGLKVYKAIDLDPGESYVGRQNRPVVLSGKIKNASEYSTSEKLYQWRVYNGTGWIDLEEKKGDATAEYIWTADGNYKVQLKAKVITEEKLLIETDSGGPGAEARVKIEGGIPVAMPGVAYRGGIAGGDFSLIQFQGNSVYIGDFGEEHRVVDWVWSFADENSESPGLLVEFYPIPDDPSDPYYIDLSQGTALDDLDGQSTSPVDVRFVDSVDEIGGSAPFSPFFARVTGFIISKAETYKFHVSSDDGFRFQIGSKDERGAYHFEEPIAEPQVSGGTEVTMTHTFESPGAYAIELICFDREYPAPLTLQWTPPAPGEGEAQQRQPIPFLSGGGSGGEVIEGGEERQKGVWNPTHSYAKAGVYKAKLYVQSDSLKWSPAKSTTVTVIDGQIGGVVRAADLRTPVPDVKLTLVPARDDEVLESVLLSMGGQKKDGSIVLDTYTEVDGSYAFQHLPLGSYAVKASKVEGGPGGDTIHEFEKPVQVAELTLSGPNSKTDFVDLSVFPISGRIYYSVLHPDGKVFVEDVVITATTAGGANTTTSEPSIKLPAGSQADNYCIPLFAGTYQFLAQRGGHRICVDPANLGDLYEDIDPENPAAGGLITIKGAREVNFIDETTRKLTVYVEDSGGFPLKVFDESNKIEGAEIGHAIHPITGGQVRVQVDGPNGKVPSLTKYPDGIIKDDIVYPTDGIVSEREVEDAEANTRTVTAFETILNPGRYTVSIEGAKPKGNAGRPPIEATVDLTGGDGEVTMVIPVKIDLRVASLPPRLLGNDVSDDFKEFLRVNGVDLADVSPPGYMFYWPDKPRKHTYVVEATANDRPVKEFTLYVTDEISQMTLDPPGEKVIPCSENKDENKVAYTISAGLPKLNPDVTEPIPAPKRIVFRAEKTDYDESDPVVESVFVLGDVNAGGAPTIHSVPVVNYTVLHDPPGDNSYAYLDDSITMKGIVSGMQIGVQDELGGDARKVPVYPSPWSQERHIEDVDFGSSETPLSDVKFQDLGDKGLLQPRTPTPAAAAFTIAGILEAASGMVASLSAPVAFALQFIKFPVLATSIESGAGIVGATGVVQYAVSPNRRLETPSGDELPDLLGPGKGDVYFGEGWTLALQNKNRLRIEPSFEDKTSLNDDDIVTLDLNTSEIVSDNTNIPDALKDRFPTLSENATVETLQPGRRWQITDPDTTLSIYDVYIPPVASGEVEELYIRKLAGEQVATYSILDRSNQYIYTIRDIENLLENLDREKADTDLGLTEDERSKIDQAKDTWERLLDRNLAYRWNKYYVATQDKIDALEEKRGKEGLTPAEEEYLAELGRVKAQIDEKNDVFDAFLSDSGRNLEGMETLMFSAGPAFEYSRRIFEGQIAKYSTSIAVSTNVKIGDKYIVEVKPPWRTGPGYEKQIGNVEVSIATNQSYSSAFLESGVEVEQTVGFALQDDDIGDNIATRVYADPQWGTPLFLQEPGSVTSDPWEAGTNKAVDVVLDLDQPDTPYIDTFDYQDGAHYRFEVRYPTEMENPNLRELESSGINFVLYAPPTDNPGGVTVKGLPLTVELSRTAPSAFVPVSIYPPAIDQGNAEPKEYSVTIQVEEEADAQIYRPYPLKITFADLRAPRAVITAPYESERISPALFPGDKAFSIQVVSFDTDLAKIALKHRYKQSDGVWSEWVTLPGMMWFSVDLAFEVDLPSETDLVSPSASLQEAFADNEFELSENAQISKRAEAKVPTWDIDDKHKRKKYTVVKEERQLSIFPDNVSPGDVSLRDLVPPRYEFTFEWSADQMKTFGEGEYAICAMATDNAATPNTDKDPPVVTFLFDNQKPSILTTIPDY